MAYKIQLVRGETVEIEVEAATASMAWNAAVSFHKGNPHHVVRCETDQGWREVRSVTYYQEVSVADGSNSETAHNANETKCKAESPEQYPIPSNGKMALLQLEAAAPHLSQLRKFGLRYKIPDELQQLVLAVDARRAQTVFDFINVTVMSEQDWTLSDEEMALRELEAAAPYLFQLRKFGLFSKIPDELQKRMLAVDAHRAQKVFDFINGIRDFTLSSSLARTFREVRARSEKQSGKSGDYELNRN